MLTKARLCTASNAHGAELYKHLVFVRLVCALALVDVWYLSVSPE